MSAKHRDANISPDCETLNMGAVSMAADSKTALNKMP